MGVFAFLSGKVISRNDDEEKFGGVNVLLKKRSWLLFLGFLLTLGMLVACSGGQEETATEGEKEEGTTEEETTEAGEKVVVGAMDTAPTGQFNPIFYTEAYESNILSFTHESLIARDENLEFQPELAESWEINEDHTSVTFKLREDVTWHDGEPFTAHDVVFTYKAIADPQYVEAGGVRSSYVTRLVGLEEYQNGETDEFPGVVALDDHTVQFNYVEPNVLALADASFPIIPEHVFADVPVIDMPEHEASLLPNKVIGTGPFKFTDMVEGEQYILTKNENYWKGEPKLDSVIWRVVNADVIIGMLESGELDFVADPSGIAPEDYDLVAAMDHIEIIEEADFGYQILGFIHNYRTEEDIEAGVINPDNFVPNPRLEDKRVRQAIAYAVDRESLIDALLYGHGEVVNSPIAKQWWVYDGETPEQYEHDLDKAKSLLEEAGYVDVDGDGFVETPEGEPYELTMAYPLGNPLRERSAPLIQDMIQKAGIKVNLLQPMEFAAYTEALEETTDWDLYLLGWSLGTTDPDPSGLWTAADAYNFGRWYNPEADQLVKEAITPPQAFERDFRKEKYQEWQVMFQEELPALLLYARNSIWAYNKRMTGIDHMPWSFLSDVHEWDVTE